MKNPAARIQMSDGEWAVSTIGEEGEFLIEKPNGSLTVVHNPADLGPLPFLVAQTVRRVAIETWQSTPGVGEVRNGV